MKKTVLLIVLLLTGSIEYLTAQQLPLYSQYMFNTLEINPAYAGFSDGIQFTSSFRKQFNGIKNAPQTSLLSIDMPIGETNLGIGLKLIDDRFSVSNTMGIQTSYSYKIQTGENSRLAMGLQIGLLNYKANLSQLLVTDEGDPVFRENVSSLIANFGTGLFFNTENFYAGVSVPNLVKANVRQTNIALTNTDVKQNTSFYVHAGYLVYLNDNFIVKPSFLLRGVKGIPLNYDINANVFYREMFSAGVSYRTRSALVSMLDFKILPQLHLGYSYDYNVSRLNTFVKGTHEVTLRYRIPFERDDYMPSYLF